MNKYLDIDDDGDVDATDYIILFSVMFAGYFVVRYAKKFIK